MPLGFLIKTCPLPLLASPTFTCRPRAPPPARHGRACPAQLSRQHGFSHVPERQVAPRYGPDRWAAAAAAALCYRSAPAPPPPRPPAGGGGGGRGGGGGDEEELYLGEHKHKRRARGRRQQQRADLVEFAHLLPLCDLRTHEMALCEPLLAGGGHMLPGRGHFKPATRHTP